jgi:hypothetical protein
MYCPAPLDAEQIAHEFCSKNQLQLLAGGWRSYLRAGRGAILLGWDAVERWRLGSLEPFAFTYIMAPADKEVAELVASYDPDSSVVVVFTSDTAVVKEHFTATGPVVVQGPVTAWVLEGAFTPREAYARLSS